MDIMENIRWKSLVVIKDTLRCSAERLWASLVHSAIEHSGRRVQLYLLNSCKKTMVKRYPFMLQCALIEEIDSFASIFDKITDYASELDERTTVFVDSIDIIALNTSFDRVIVLLEAISQYATVIARTHSECISSHNWERLSSICHMTYSLELTDTMTPRCTVVSFKIDGKRTIKVGKVCIDDLFRAFFKQHKTQDANISANNLPQLKSSFDVGLCLKKSEFEAKGSLSLPHEAAQKKDELVRLCVRESRKVRAGGRIIYIPDEADDFDESDPDDDLEI